MKIKYAFFAALCLCLATGLAALGSKDSGAYPARNISLVVPYGAGGTSDLAGRELAKHLAKYLGKPVNVINQAGASGATGTKTVFDAEADGYTVLFSADSLGTQRVMGLSSMSYADFTPILVAVNDPKVIVVKKDSRYKTLRDLTDDMKARPGRVKMSYTGPGGSGHVQALIYNKFGLDMALTAYPGGADCIVAVLGGQVDFTNSNYSTVTSYIESGELVLLGVSATDRLPSYPNAPTLVEAIPESARYLQTPFTPLSVLVKNTTPPEVVKILRDAADKAVNDPAWKAYCKTNCLEELYLKYPGEAAAKKFFSDWESEVSWLLFDAKAAKISPEQFNIPRPR